MPTAVREQDDYHASPHRHQSSWSQTSLHDQLPQSEPYAPSRSAVMLPSTTYQQSPSQSQPLAQSPQARARSPPGPNNLSRLDTSVNSASSIGLGNTNNPPSSANPDDFYRQYPPASEPQILTAGSLHQDALRTLSAWENVQSGGGSNGSYSTTWSADDPRDSALPPPIPGLKSRKSSVKNLVAQINASSTADTPPVPTQPVTNTYTVMSPSPYLSSSHVSPFNATARGARKYSNPSVPPSVDRGQRRAGDSNKSGSRSQESFGGQRRPLFGEILPHQPVAQSAGYGIVNPRRRTASESSPMHSPNPIFPPDEPSTSQFVLSATVYGSNPPRSDHRRTNSDRPQGAIHPTAPVSSRRPPVVSRIPVSSRKMGAASDSGNSTPNSRAPSALGRQQHNETPRKLTKTPDPKQSLRVDQSGSNKITSPGRRGKSNTSQLPKMQPGAKSPSLRANIIAPPPKISPPLRSSRPRLPVSSATTAASRARMAERFNTMQKLNDERRAAPQRRVKPPELTDVDLNARRLRITQALTRSKESEEMRGRYQTGKRWEPPSRTGSPRPDSAVLTSFNHHPDSDDMNQNDYDDDTYNGTFHRDDATRNALDLMDDGASQGAEAVDSPILGREHERPTVQVQTQFLDVPSQPEPMSAVTDMTAGTEATHIDPEPQDELSVDAPSLLNHVRQLRDPSPSTEYSHHVSQRYDPDDRADVESVNLVLRNTTYLDDEEALRKGYTANFTVPEPLPEEDDDHDSWTSLRDDVEQDDSYLPSSDRASHDQQRPFDEGNSSRLSRDDSFRDTMASDAYTIINIVLQEHSTSGIVDQQLADDVYQKFLETYPEVEDEGAYDSKKIEELCLQEIGRRGEPKGASEPAADPVHADANGQTPPSETEEVFHDVHDSKPQLTESPTRNENLLTLPSSKYEGHRHKSSLDSAEDWASTSPSVGDWMRFVNEQVTPPEQSQRRDPLDEHGRMMAADTTSVDAHDYAGLVKTTGKPRLASLDSEEDTIGPEEYGIAIIRAPSTSPTPPPKDSVASIDQTIASSVPTTVEGAPRQPRVPSRLASLGQVAASRQSQSQSRPPSARERAEITPWEVQEPGEESPSPEMVRLKKRKHIIKELVDTEFTYQRDMRVLCDIYRQTAAAALTEDDIRVLFGNVEQVQVFARDFLTALKQTSKPATQRREKKDAIDALLHGNSSSSTVASTKMEQEASDLQKDRQTQIGQAFEGSLKDMELVYTEYIRNRHAANQRLETLQRSAAAQEWLKECRDNSSDITNAWNLDALLVKPVQRITKYPLLLKELIDATVEDHPDLPTLRRVLISVTDINMRINDLKRHAEALDSALVRKRGQSDVRTGLSKAFGRRAEKLRQHVGMTEMYDDPEYDKLRIKYDNNYVQLMVVSNDCQIYEKGMTQWVDKMVQVAAAVEGWVDVGHSHHQQEESKLRHLVMIIRNIQNIALPDHMEHLQKKVIKPMLATVDVLTKFKDDPKGLLQKRDKRQVDYAQMRNKKEKGEKIDKKTAERMDQWEALNTEAKERMRKLLTATAHLVQTCLGHLAQLQMTWMALIQQKFASVMGINIHRLSPEDIERDWQVDFDYQEASALALSICNGALMLQAANMTNFLTPGSTTLNGDDSPRQASFSSGHNKRSVSLNSESSTIATLDFSSRPSGTYTSQTLSESHFDRPYPYPNGRTRAASTTSGKVLQRPDLTSRSSTHVKHTSTSANFPRPGASPVVAQEVFAPPRLSVETYSPLLSSFQLQTQPERPHSSNTFVSAAAGPSNSQAPRPRGSGIFSSAMPMSDSPVQERHSTGSPVDDPKVLFTAASVYEFNIDRARTEAGKPYLTYVTGEIFDVIGEKGELWLARNQDDPNKEVGWIWNKHFAKLAD